MTQEEFNNLLRVQISADKKWYTSPARLVEFLTKDGSSYAIVYNENTKRFQRVSLVDILSVEDPMIESEPKEVDENVDWFVKLFGKDAFSVMDKFKNKYTMQRTENGFEFVSKDGKEGFSIQLKGEPQENKESELTPMFPDNVDGKPFYDVASAAQFKKWGEELENGTISNIDFEAYKMALGLKDGSNEPVLDTKNNVTFDKIKERFESGKLTEAEEKVFSKMLDIRLKETHTKNCQLVNELKKHFQSDESCKDDNLGANMNKYSLNKAIDEGGISGSYESQMKASNKSEEREYYGGC